jgi:adenylate kinase
MKVIIVTGTPGTGKTTLSKKLVGMLGFHYIDVNEIVKKYGISEGYDRKRKTKVIDVKKLNKALIKEIKTYTEKNSIISSNKKISLKIKKTLKNHNKNKLIKNKKLKNGIIIDSHLSHHLPKKYVDLCVVVKCDLKVLEHRLKKKGYSKGKVRENLDAEIFDVCLNEAKQFGHMIVVIDTTKDCSINSIFRKLGGAVDIK